MSDAPDSPPSHPAPDDAAPPAPPSAPPVTPAGVKKPWLAAIARSTIVLCFGLLLALGITLGAAAVGYWTLEQAQERDQQRLELLTSALQSQASQWFEASENALDRLATTVQRNPNVLSLLPLQQREILQNLPFLRSVTLLNAQGDVLITTDGEQEGRRANLTALIRQPLHSQRMSIGAVFAGHSLPLVLDASGGDEALPMAAPSAVVPAPAAHSIALLRQVSLGAGHSVVIVALLNPEGLALQQQQLRSSTAPSAQVWLLTSDDMVLSPPGERGPSPLPAAITEENQGRYGPLKPWQPQPQPLGAWQRSSNLPLWTLAQQPFEATRAQWEAQMRGPLWVIAGVLLALLLCTAIAWHITRVPPPPFVVPVRRRAEPQVDLHAAAPAAARPAASVEPTLAEPMLPESAPEPTPTPVPLDAPLVVSLSPEEPPEPPAPVPTPAAQVILDPIAIDSPELDDLPLDLPPAPSLDLHPALSDADGPDGMDGPKIHLLTPETPEAPNPEAAQDDAIPLVQNLRIDDDGAEDDISAPVMVDIAQNIAAHIADDVADDMATGIANALVIDEPTPEPAPQSLVPVVSAAPPKPSQPSEPLKLERMDLRDVLQTALTELRPQMQAKGVEALAQLGRMALWTQIDLLRFTPVVRALLANAIARSPQGGAISLSTSSSTVDDDWVEITLRDQGPEIPAQRLAQLLPPLAPKGDSPQDLPWVGQGDALSLADCQSLIAAHGGRMDIANAPEGGVLLHIHLPCEEDPDAGIETLQVDWL